MDSMRSLLARLLSLFRRQRLDRELEQELEAHLALAIEDNLRSGMSASEARRRARIRLGGLEATKELHRDARGLPLLGSVLQDVRYSLRMLRRYRGWTTFAILIIGLGVGASTTVFSVVHALLVRPLPLEAPEQLIWLENDGGPTRSEKTIQVAHLQAINDSSNSLLDAAGYDAFTREGDHRLGGAGEPQRLTGIRVTGNFFPLLGIQPHLGRWFSPEECLWNGPRAVILSHGLWQRRFGSDPQMVDRVLLIDDEPVTVVGILPASFHFPAIFDPGSQADLFWSFPLGPETNRRGNTLFLLGRLKPGVSLDSARAYVNTLALQAREEAQLNEFHPRMTTLREHVSGEHRRAMLVLGGAVILVMLIVCANLSNLLLARDSSREKEIAIRAALGASRARLVQQALTESLILSVSGAVLGLLLALGGTSLLAHQDAIKIPLRELIRVDAAALGFTSVVAVLTGLVFGLAPALRLSGVGLLRPLKETGRSSTMSPGQNWIRSALVVSEVAIACVLLVGAGLLTRSFLRLLDVDLGFQARSVVTLRIDPGRHFTSRDVRAASLEAMLDQMRLAPGIDAAGLTDSLPLGRNRQWSIGAKGRIYERGEKPHAYVHVVSEGYLQAMGISLTQGRDFSVDDDGSHPPVLLVNETLARLLWPGADPLGRSAELYGGERQVVGVVRDVRHLSVAQGSGPEMYLALRQMRDYSSIHLTLRGTRSASDLAAIARDVIHPIDPTLPVQDFRTMQNIVDRSISPRRFIVTLLAGFAAFALFLASLGIYGVISFSVSQRTQEIGVRMALGATAPSVKRWILTGTIRLTALGLVLGYLVSLFLGEAIQGLLFDVTPSDPMTLVSVLGVLFMVAILAGYLPARRASRLDPMQALRAE
jgi:predicted permease